MAAVFPLAAGLVTHSGNLTPEIWTGKTLVKFYKKTVFGEICNTDYEGEIKAQGDTVHIRNIPDITISDHAIDQELNYERPTTTVTDLLIDKGKSYSFSVNKIEEVQADLNYVEKWTTDAGEQLAISIDTAILADVYGDASSNNSGAAAGAVSAAYDMGASGAPESCDKTNILDYIVDMGSVLTEQNVPDRSRWLVLPAAFCGMIKKGDLKDASLAGDAESIIRNGRLGRIDDFTIYKSNSVATTTDGTDTVHNIIFGHPTAITFASQLVDHETLNNPKTFGDLVRGLNVYGYKVVKPEALGHFYAKVG
jgi:hypothetical protein